MAVDRFPIEASHIMMFARAIGDPNPIYHDAEHAATTEPGHIIAPPTFAQASAQFDPDYRLRPKIGERMIFSNDVITTPIVEVARPPKEVVRGSYSLLEPLVVHG